jgi:hypothetical protein
MRWACFAAGKDPKIGLGGLMTDWQGEVHAGGAIGFDSSRDVKEGQRYFAPQVTVESKEGGSG